MNNFIFLGAPGAGKGSLAVKVAEEYKINVDDMKSKKRTKDKVNKNYIWLTGYSSICLVQFG